jgi:predicted nuclease with TOPRIM domain
MTLVQDKTEKAINGFKELLRDKDDEMKKLAAEKDDQIKKLAADKDDQIKKLVDKMDKMDNRVTELIDEQKQNELKYEERIKKLENENKNLKEVSVVKCKSIETSNVYTNGIWIYVPIMLGVPMILYTIYRRGK